LNRHGSAGPVCGAAGSLAQRDQSAKEAEDRNDQVDHERLTANFTSPDQIWGAVVGGMANETLESAAGVQLILLDIVSEDDSPSVESVLNHLSSPSELGNLIDLVFTVAGSRVGASSKFAELIMSNAEKVSSVQRMTGGDSPEEVELMLAEADLKVDCAAIGSALAGFAPNGGRLAGAHRLLLGSIRRKRLSCPMRGTTTTNVTRSSRGLRASAIGAMSWRR
jgi:hypothetical protein